MDDRAPRRAAAPCRRVARSPERQATAERVVPSQRLSHRRNALIASDRGSIATTATSSGSSAAAATSSAAATAADERHVCPMCRKRFLSNHALYTHMRQALRLAPSRSSKCDLLGRTAAELAAVAARWEEVLQRKDSSHRAKKDAAIEARQQSGLGAQAAAAAANGHMLGGGEDGGDEGGGGGDEGVGGDGSDGSDGSDGEAVELPRGRKQKSKSKGGQRRRIDRAKRQRIENREALARLATEQAQREAEPEPEPGPGYKSRAASAPPFTTRAAASGDGMKGGVEGGVDAGVEGSVERASAATAPQSFAQTMRDVLERRGRQSLTFGHIDRVTAAADVAASCVTAAGAAASGTGAIGAAVREAVATADGEGGEGPADGGVGCKKRKKRGTKGGRKTGNQRKTENHAREDLGLLKLVKAASHAAAGSRSGRCTSYTGVVEDDDGGGDDDVEAIGLATGGGDGVQATSGEARGGRAAAAGSSDAFYERRDAARREAARRATSVRRRSAGTAELSL